MKAALGPFALALLPALVVQLALFQDTEPFYNNDETRHLMTGVFFRDYVAGGDWLHPRRYATDYYLQYPALGLLVWPPGLHVAEGVWFLIWGPTYLAGRILVELFLVLACGFLFRLVSLTHGRRAAVGAVALFGILPIVVPFSRQIMGEIPALAWMLGSIYHFERYLTSEQRQIRQRAAHEVSGGSSTPLTSCAAPPVLFVQRKRDAWLAGLFAAFAALTRFDAVLLLPYFAGRLLLTKQWRLLMRWPVIGGVLLAAGLTAPYYYVTWKEYGGAVATAAAKGTDSNSTGFLNGGNFLYYPAALPFQMSWYLLVPALIGLVGTIIDRNERRRAGPYLMLIAAVYLTFTPLAELDERHAIPWLPAWSLFGFLGLQRFIAGNNWRRLIGFAAVAAVLIGLLWDVYRRPVDRVFGYAAAAEYTVARTPPHKRILIDAFLNGGFIYDVRRLARDKHLTVLRGDKLFYGMVSDPHGGYAEYVKDPEDAARILFDWDPEYIVVEQPLLHDDLPAARRLREALVKYPERFELVEAVPIRSNREIFLNGRLEIYRNLKRNPHPIENVAFPMLNLGKDLKRE